MTDPLSGFYADGTHDDTANFSTLRADPLWARADVDLRQATYLVTAIPSGPFHNGFFRINNAVGGLNVDFPATDTLEATTVKLTVGKRYATWPQDKCHEYGGVVYAFWNEGAGHTSIDTHVRCARSYDGGQSWTNYERLFQHPSQEAWAAAAGVFEGQQIIVVRNRTLDPNEPTSFRMYGRRLEERRARVTARVYCVAGSTSYRLYIADASMKLGDRFELLDVSATVGGNSLQGTVLTASGQVGSYFGFNTSSPASVAEDKSITFDIAFIEGDFSEILWWNGSAAVSLGQAMIDYGSPFNGLPSVIQSIAAFRTGPGQENIKIYLGVSGSIAGGGVVLMELTGLTRANQYRFISGAARIGVSTSGLVEPTVTFDPVTLDLYGFIRSQSPGTPPQFWWSSAANRLVTSTVQLPAGRAVGYLSPIPARVYGDKIYAFLVGDRENGETVGPVPAHLLIADKTAAKTAGDFSPWRAIRLGELTHAVEAASSAVGVPSMAIDYDSNKLLLFYGDEGFPLPGSSRTSGTTADVYCTTIGIGEILGGPRQSIQKILGRAALQHIHGIGGTEADAAYIEELFGTNSAAAWGLYDSNGDLLIGYNMGPATLTSTGLYECPLISPVKGVVPVVTSIGNDGSVAIGRSTIGNDTSFVKVDRRVGGTLTNGRFSVVVFSKDDRYRIS